MAGHSKKNATHRFWKLTGIFSETFLTKNIVLVQAIGICPIIAVGTNLKYAIVLTICTAAVLLPCSLFMSVYGDKIPAPARPLVYTLAASALLVGAAFIVDRWVSAQIYAVLYLFLPLMAVNTIFTYRGRRLFGQQPPRRRPGGRSRLVAGLRAGYLRGVGPARAGDRGTLWDIPMGFDLRLPEAAQPLLPLSCCWASWPLSCSG